MTEQIIQTLKDTFALQLSKRLEQKTVLQYLAVRMKIENIF